LFFVHLCYDIKEKKVRGTCFPLLQPKTTIVRSRMQPSKNLQGLAILTLIPNSMPYFARTLLYLPLCTYTKTGLNPPNLSVTGFEVAKTRYQIEYSFTISGKTLNWKSLKSLRQALIFCTMHRFRVL
jgi:hypothetical protein